MIVNPFARKKFADTGSIETAILLPRLNRLIQLQTVLYYQTSFSPYLFLLVNIRSIMFIRTKNLLGPAKKNGLLYEDNSNISKVNVLK